MANIENNIRRKIGRWNNSTPKLHYYDPEDDIENVPVEFDYGSPEVQKLIVEKIGQPEYEYIVEETRIPIRGLVNYLLYQYAGSNIPRYLSSLGFIEISSNFGAYVDLFWYLNLTPPDVRTKLTMTEVKYLSRLSVDKLVNFLPGYRGSRDKASLLYALYTGQSTTVDSTIDKRLYEKVSKMNPVVIANIFSRLILKSADYGHELKGPYMVVCENYIADFDVFLKINYDNIDDFMDEYGVVINPVTDKYNLMRKSRKIFTVTNLMLHNNGVIANKTGNDTSLLSLNNPDYNVLLGYTMRELIDYYDPAPEAWINHTDLLNTIMENDLLWSSRHKYCNNDDTMNLLELDYHGNINKDDPNNPTISYGVNHNYSCYQVDELDYSFREYGDTFRFNNPDWVDPQNGNARINPVTGRRTRKTFGNKDIERLSRFSEMSDNSYYGRDSELYNKVYKGQQLLTNGYLQNVLRSYSRMTESEQYYVNFFMVWLFTFGMWMRFWKGPGNPWPQKRFNVNDQKDIDAANRCSPKDRDEYSIIQQKMYKLIYTDLVNMDLGEWIKQIPMFEYSDGFRYADITDKSLYHALDILEKGGMCQGFAGDNITITGYQYLLYFLNIDEDDDEMINNVINSHLDVIMSYEHDATQQIMDEIAADLQIHNKEHDNSEYAKDLRNRYKILFDRWKATTKDKINNLYQPSFNPDDIDPNQHLHDDFD